MTEFKKQHPFNPNYYPKPVADGMVHGPESVARGLTEKYERYISQRDNDFQKEIKRLGDEIDRLNMLILPPIQKTETKYRKNGALVFAPKFEDTCYSIDVDSFAVYKEEYLSEDDFDSGLSLDSLLKLGLLFDFHEKAQSWADKLKIAYELKQRIVEAESETDCLSYVFALLGETSNSRNWVGSLEDMNNSLEQFKTLIVSSVAKDILMSRNVSDEHYQYYIEVFSL